jgi:enoyl-CoA hydratase
VTQAAGRLDYAVREGIARLTIANEAKRNAMQLAMWRAMPDICARFAADPQARVLVLSGAGDKAFCAGNDISEFARVRSTAEQVAAYNAATEAACHALASLEKPTVAAIVGACMGGGLELALLCDLRYAAVGSEFAIPAGRMGLPYRFDNLSRVVELIGPARALEMVYTARRIGADEAARLNLVHEALPDATALNARVEEIAATVAGHAPLTLRAAKLMLREMGKRDAAPDMALAQRLVEEGFASADYAEGRKAFAEKRRPAFVGR